MPLSASGHGALRRWMLRRLGLKRLSRPDPAPASALAFIASHHGLGTENMASDNANGDGLETLCFRALGLGLRSRIVRTDATSLSRLQLPCLVRHEHLGWLPLVAVHDDHVVLRDPQQGRVRLQRDTWDMEFNGLALEFRRGG